MTMPNTNETVTVEGRIRVQGERGTRIITGEGRTLEEARKDAFDWCDNEYGAGSWEVAD
jgi:hypothetical protein